MKQSMALIRKSNNSELKKGMKELTKQSCACNHKCHQAARPTALNTQTISYPSPQHFPFTEKTKRPNTIMNKTRRLCVCVYV